MMGRREAHYFTFPVELLRVAFIPKVTGNVTGIFRTCDDAINYAVFVRCKDYKLTPIEAFTFFGITGNADASFARGEELFNSFGRPVLVSIAKGILFEFMRNPKTDFEICVFCAFCGLRSIVGTKSFVKSNNSLLLARIFGYTTAGEFEKLEMKPAYYELHFSTNQKVRYQLTDKIIKNELMLNWGLKYYSNQSKGFYISFSLDFEDLVMYVEKSRKSILLKQQQQEQRQIIERVKKQVQAR